MSSLTFDLTIFFLSDKDSKLLSFKSKNTFKFFLALGKSNFTLSLTCVLTPSFVLYEVPNLTIPKLAFLKSSVIVVFLFSFLTSSVSFNASVYK